jgi:hypothetical protein
MTARSAIDQAAREAAIATWDAFGEFVSADQAYGFIREVWADTKDTLLPETRPAEFRHDYDRYCRCIRECNPFIVCELTRPA